MTNPFSDNFNPWGLVATFVACGAIAAAVVFGLMVLAAVWAGWFYCSMG